MSTTTYKLTYFNNRGRAELSRLVFAAAGVPYQDVRVTDDQWTAIKHSAPFHQIPTLEFDSTTLCQSFTIARYLSRKFGLLGKTELEEAQTDMVVHCINDTIDTIFKSDFLFPTDAGIEKRDAIRKKYLDELLPVFLSMLEKLLIANNGGDGFFVGDKLTWADLAVVDMAGILRIAGGDVQIANYPKLSGLLRRVEHLPAIAEWLSKRPVTPF